MVVNVNSNEENYNPGKLNIIVTSREKGSFTDDIFQNGLEM